MTDESHPTPVRAAVCRAFGQPLSIETLMLAPPGPNDVRVDVSACAICHSDILFIDGGWGGELPAVWGHEAAGVVAEVGANVSRVTVGDQVVVTLIRSCGECRSCTRGAPATCQVQFELDGQSPLTDTGGSPVGHGLRTAAFAEQVVVHESQVVTVAADISPEAASLLACGVITGVGSVTNTAAVEAGSSVVVIGAGGVGLNVIQGARMAGADPIIVADLVDQKLTDAEAFGATHGVNPATEDLAARVAEITNGGADYVFVAVGAKAAVDGAANMLAPNGALVLVGIPASGVTTEIDPVTIASSNQSILGSKMGGATVDGDIPRLAEAYQNGDLELDALVSRTYPLDQINDAIDSVRAGEARRNIIVFEPRTETTA